MTLRLDLSLPELASPGCWGHGAALGSHSFSLPWLSRVAAWGYCLGDSHEALTEIFPGSLGSTVLTLVHVGCQALVEWLEGAASRWSWWLLWFSTGQARHHLSRVLAPMFLTFVASAPRCCCCCCRWVGVRRDDRSCSQAVCRSCKRCRWCRTMLRVLW